jgi:HSP20 family protein
MLSMMERGRNDRDGREGFFSRMRGGHGHEGHGRGGDECERTPDFHGCPDSGDWVKGMHGLRGMFMHRFGHHMDGFSHMKRGVFDPCGFVEDVFKVEVKDTDENYLIEAELPGFSKEAISLSRLPGMLVITVNEEDEKATERPLFLAHCDEENIHARYHDGVLEITVPKTKGQKIEIAQ